MAPWLCCCEDSYVRGTVLGSPRLRSFPVGEQREAYDGYRDARSGAQTAVPARAFVVAPTATPQPGPRPRVTADHASVLQRATPETRSAVSRAVELAALAARPQGPDVERRSSDGKRLPRLAITGDVLQRAPCARPAPARFERLTEENLARLSGGQQLAPGCPEMLGDRLSRLGLSVGKAATAVEQFSDEPEEESLLPFAGAPPGPEAAEGKAAGVAKEASEATAETLASLPPGPGASQADEPPPRGVRAPSATGADLAPTELPATARPAAQNTPEPEVELRPMTVR